MLVKEKKQEVSVSFTVKHKLTGEDLYPGLTGTYTWAMGLSRKANIRDDCQHWVVYRVEKQTVC